MAATNSAEHERLVALARAQQSPSAETAASWQLVVRGLVAGYVVESNLEEIAHAVESGPGICIEEIDFDAVGDEVEVSFVDETARCPRREMADMLRALAHRFALGPDFARGEELGRAAVAAAAVTPPPVADAPHTHKEELRCIAELLVSGLLAKETSAANLTPELARLVQSARELSRLLAQDSSCVDLAAVDLSGVSFASPSPEAVALAAALEAPLRDLLASEQEKDPRAAADWLEALGQWLRGDPAAGVKVDRLLAKLEASAGHVLGSSDAERNSRAVRDKARASIRAALRKRGFPTDEGS